MSTYLQLCNKVIEEGGLDQNLLNETNWYTIEATRKVYPRVKRLVAEAWKMIQMNRSEWQWKTKEMSTVVSPRIRFYNGASEPSLGASLFGKDTGSSFKLKAVYLESGTWLAGTAAGQFDLSDVAGGLLSGEEIVDSSDTVIAKYEQKGSYDFKAIDPSLRNINWSTFVAAAKDRFNKPVLYIPWENWIHKDTAYVFNNAYVPSSVSQDLQGNVVFYPQVSNDFRVSFMYEAAPSSLAAFDDIPEELKEEYHDWIAWLALANLAQYDKNITLYQYAAKMEQFYRTRAERGLMPMPSWGSSPYNLVAV